MLELGTLRLYLAILTFFLGIPNKKKNTKLGDDVNLDFQTKKDKKKFTSCNSDVFLFRILSLLFVNLNFCLGILSLHLAILTFFLFGILSLHLVN